MAAHIAHPDDQALMRLRAEFTGHRIWRSVRSDGLLGDWCATLHDPAAGVEPTVIRDDAAALRAALVREAATRSASGSHA
ncbi:hypothetical protein [Actinomadura parmotrematis]|uniref:Uncharacterized protein n=1 Tax=Actinomadura parmotrematis TaxID=2864039 RepID=A0ABS7FQY5_9ACTN|nr:hypothetical protein [Actinomadura parmotrematis]MBW8482139.1 hypothetical protein [Actinomadura parmotrematis]